MYYDDFNDFDIADEGFFCHTETRVSDLLKIIRSNIASSLTTPDQALVFLKDISHEIVEFNEIITEIQNAYGECNSGLISKEDAHAIIADGAAKLKSQCKALKLMPAGVLSDSDDIEYEELAAIKELLAGCKTLAEERYQELTNFPGDGSWGKAATLVHAAGESTGLDDEDIMLLAMEGIISKAKEKLKKKKKSEDDEDLDGEDDDDDDDDKKSKKRKKLFGRKKKKDEDEDPDDEGAEESWFDFDDDFDSAFEEYDESDDDLDSAFEFQDTKLELGNKAMNPVAYGANRGFRVAHIRKRLPIIKKADEIMDDAKRTSGTDPQDATKKMKSAQKMYERALQQALSAKWCNSTVEAYLKHKVDTCRAYVLKYDGDGRTIREIMKSFAKERSESIKDARKRLKSGEDLGAEESWLDFDDEIFDDEFYL